LPDSELALSRRQNLRRGAWFAETGAAMTACCHGRDGKVKPERWMLIAECWFSHAARALEHCRCGQAQRSFGPLPSAASEQAWLQYFSPAETGQVHCGLAQRSSITASVMKASMGRCVELFQMQGNGVRKVSIRGTDV